MVASAASFAEFALYSRPKNVDYELWSHLGNASRTAYAWVVVDSSPQNLEANPLNTTFTPTAEDNFLKMQRTNELVAAIDSALEASRCQRRHVHVGEGYIEVMLNREALVRISKLDGVAAICSTFEPSHL